MFLSGVLLVIVHTWHVSYWLMLGNFSDFHGQLRLLAQVFYFCFAFGEMWLKLQSFREAWTLARRSEGMAPFQRRDCTWARSTVRRISQATEKRSICVLCCTIFEWLQAVMPSWLGIGVAIAGVSFHRPALIVVGSVWTGLLLFTTVLTLPRWGQVPMVGSSWITHYFPRPEILQDWGENWCNLGIHAQVRQRYHAALMLALCAVIFGAFRTWACQGPAVNFAHWYLSRNVIDCLICIIYFVDPRILLPFSTEDWGDSA